MEAIVHKCLAKKATDRYATMEELAADLERFVAGDEGAITAPQLTRVRRLRQWVVWHRARLAGAAVAVVAAVVLVWVGVLWAAPVPRTSDEKLDPLEDIRKELAADRRAAILGSAGPPRNARWVGGRATLIQPTERQPEFAFEAPDPTLLEMLANPGLDEYSVTAEVQLLYHKAIVRPGGKETVEGGGSALIGVYFGELELATTKGEPVYVSLAVNYCDFLAEETRLKLKDIQATVQLRTIAIVAQADGGLQGTKASAGMPNSFELSDKLPAPWRRIRIEVRPSGIKAFWAETLTANWQSLGTLTAENIADRLNKMANGLRVELATHSPLVWNPSAPIGIYCEKAAMSVRNVVVEALP